MPTDANERLVYENKQKFLERELQKKKADDAEDKKFP